MKNIHIAILSVILFSSCQPLYYQLYEVKPKETTSPVNFVFDKMVYEDSNCKIIYGFWSNGGDAGFTFYNKTDDDIYLLLDKSNFIENGVAYDYYKNREYATSKGSSVSSTSFKQSGASLSASGTTQNTTTNTKSEPLNTYPSQYSSGASSSSSASINASRGSASSKSFSSEQSLIVKEDSVVRIPGKTQKIFSEYSINKSVIRNCDLILRPSIIQKEVIYSNYEESNSPLTFGNLIRYRVNGEINSVRNEFYISRISNYPQESFVKYKKDEFCGERNLYKTKYYIFLSPSSFYYSYR